MRWSLREGKSEQQLTVLGLVLGAYRNQHLLRFIARLELDRSSSLNSWGMELVPGPEVFFLRVG